MSCFELNDKRWEAIADLFPQKGRRGRRQRGHRVIVEGILWVLSSNSVWRGLPARYGPWRTALRRFNGWEKDGTWARVAERLGINGDGAHPSRDREGATVSSIMKSLPDGRGPDLKNIGAEDGTSMPRGNGGMAKRALQVYIAIPTHTATNRNCLRGVIAFAEEHGWDCEMLWTEPAYPEYLHRAAQSADGLILTIGNPRITEMVAQLNMPVVVLSQRSPAHVPSVYIDPVATSRLAMEHFLERGFRHFAYYGSRKTPSSAMKETAFTTIVKSYGYACKQWDASALPSKDRGTFRDWLRRLPKPAALLCENDIKAREAAMICKDIGIRVPDEIAMLGVSNDELVCSLCKPLLSSIDADDAKVGFEAAKLLQRMFDGEQVSTQPVLVPPVRVVTRESTDVIVANDPQIRAAADYIQQHMAKGINVKELVRRLDVGRRTLEVAFRRQLGRTVHAEITRAQVQRACGLLEASQLPLSQIAGACGMRYRSHLNSFFKKHMGMTPLEYRKRYQRKRI